MNYLFSFFVAFFIFSCSGMDIRKSPVKRSAPESEPEKRQKREEGTKTVLTEIPQELTYQHSSQHDIIGSMLNFVNELNTGDKVDLTIYSFTHDGLSKALIDAHERGALVSVISSRQFANSPQLKKLAEAGIFVGIINIKNKENYLLEHDKNINFKLYSPNKKVHKYLSITGSSNFTNLADRNNDESVVLVPNDIEIYDTLGQYHNTLKQYAQPFKNYSADNPTLLSNCPDLLQPKFYLKQTPQKNKVSVSTNHNHMESIKKRIDDSDKGDILKMREYSWKNWDLTKTIARFLKRGGNVNLLIDKSASQDSTTQAQLKILHTAGANIRLIKNENSDFSIPGKQHEKGVYLERSSDSIAKKLSKKLLILSTGNVHYGSDQLNTSFFTKDENLIEKFLAVESELLKKSEPFSPVEEPLLTKSVKRALTFN